MRPSNFPIRICTSICDEKGKASLRVHQTIVVSCDSGMRRGRRRRPTVRRLAAPGWSPARRRQ